MSRNVRELKVVDKSTKEVQHDLGLDAGIYDMVELEKEMKLAEEVQVRLQDIIGQALNVDRAKYKLEIYFPYERLRMRPYPGIMSVWNNGGFAHGGGDHNVYLCTAKVEKNGVTKTCAHPIDLRFVNRDMAICETCKTVFKPDDLCGQIFARLTTQYWAQLILKVFRRLEGDADINLTFVDEQLRLSTEEEMKVKYRKGDLINASRRQRKYVQYPLKNIIKDTSNGADLFGRIQALLAS